jgi:hypothetical protein
MDKLERKLVHKEGELDMLQIANEALQAQAKVTPNFTNNGTREKEKNTFSFCHCRDVFSPCVL